MRLVSFQAAGRDSYGLVSGAGIVDLGKRFGARAASLQALLAAGLLDEARSYAEDPADLRLDEATLLPPIVKPEHVWCLAINYMEHIEEVKSIGVMRDPPKKPALFMRYADTLVAHGAPMLKPTVSDAFDYECELAVVIGKGGGNISEADALAHVAGYTAFNDGSIRDWQFHTTQIAPGKNFHATGGIGPWIVTADEIKDPHNLALETRLNGQVLQRGNTKDLLFGVPALIAYISAILPLVPGDIIATGTPAGVGFSRKPPIFMKPGDVCEIEVEGVGVLKNPIAAAS